MRSKAGWRPALGSAASRSRATRSPAATRRRVDRDLLERALAADPAGRGRVEAPRAGIAQQRPGDLDRVGGQVRGRPDPGRAESISPSPNRKPRASSSSSSGRSHRHRERLAVDPDLERILDRHLVGDAPSRSIRAIIRDSWPSGIGADSSAGYPRSMAETRTSDTTAPTTSHGSVHPKGPQPDSPGSSRHSGSPAGPVSRAPCRDCFGSTRRTASTAPAAPGRNRTSRTGPSSARTEPRRSPRRRPGTGRGPEFFAAHPVDELAGRSEHWLGPAGRLTEPMHLAPGDYALPADLLGRRLRPDRRPAARLWTAPTRRSSTPRAAPATRPRSSTSCSPAASAPTTCPTARTCATSRAAAP